MSDKVKLTRPSFRDLLWLFARVLKTSPFIATVWVILVLINAGDEGQLVEDGTHEELLAMDGLYAKMWNAQASWYA
ncbi:hypothetical protein F4009_24895 [Candidatus Poribacteria bacterium]|nr:hypothetical protein [Candidatus Poribacteria bacterium]MYH79567.1 hypothetical protein [Candidatus Poribacteria bacterium]MYK97196.1 hypothetical protein [Candidatus Poribacteria bacterium]